MVFSINLLISIMIKCFIGYKTIESLINYPNKDTYCSNIKCRFFENSFSLKHGIPYVNSYLRP